VVGTAEDLGISAGSTSPFDRPQLGNWQTNRLDEFDILIFYPMDRVVRRLLDQADVIRWCQDHSKTVVSATEPFLDPTLAVPHAGGSHMMDQLPGLGLPRFVRRVGDHRNGDEGQHYCCQHRNAHRPQIPEFSPPCRRRTPT
jgi:Resolvase, N terminal domain